jgi:hypothetical protein
MKNGAPFSEIVNGHFRYIRRIVLVVRSLVVSRIRALWQVRCKSWNPVLGTVHVHTNILAKRD